MASNSKDKDTSIAHTVLGTVPSQELGVVLIHESLLSVVPGAEFGSEINMDRTRIFEALQHTLTEYRRLGGGTLVDRGGMSLGRDVSLYRLLSKETGVHIVASTGLGPEPMVGAYFTTPPTMMLNPPKPMPVDHLADLFASEVMEGIVVPRRERSGPAGVIRVAASRGGITLFEKQLYRAAARAALLTGAAVSVQVGSDAEYELDILEREGLAPGRVIVGDLDRVDVNEREDIVSVARRGAMVALDHAGWSPHKGYVSDYQRAQLVLELCEKGLGDRLLISSNAVGCAFGHDAPVVGFGHLLGEFVPILKQAGGTEDHMHLLLEENPQRLLTLDAADFVAKHSKEWSII